MGTTQRDPKITRLEMANRLHELRNQLRHFESEVQRVTQEIDRLQIRIAEHDREHSGEAAPAREPGKKRRGRDRAD